MNLLEEKPHGLAAKLRAEGHAAGGPGGGATVDCRSEESVLNGEVNLRIGLPEVGSLHVGASTGAHGGSRENTFQPGEGRCRTPPQAAEVSPQPLQSLEISGFFIFHKWTSRRRSSPHACHFPAEHPVLQSF